MTTPTFQIFWDTYSLKRDRIAAERAWNRLSAKDKQAALAGIEPYREECQRRGINRMYAQGYLNHRRWEDDLTPPTDPPSVVRSPLSVVSNPPPTDLATMDIWP